MIGVVDVNVQAKSPNLPLFPLRAFKGSPSSLRVRNAPKRVGDWNLTRVYVTVEYPDGAVDTADCVRAGGVWVGTVNGSGAVGRTRNGYTVWADGTDENGNAVTGYQLGKGDVVVLDSDGTPSPDPERTPVRLLSAEAPTPLEGDMWEADGTWRVWQGGQARSLSHYVPFTIKQDRTLYPSSQAITVKTSPAKTLSVATNPNGSGGTFVANFLTYGWDGGAALSDAVTAPDTVGCFVFKTGGQLNGAWGGLKSTPISAVESFGIALPL